ncbi:MAG: hypothetical protein P1V20_19630, partial [Verrucomicrobiales bacterium]|nr:hypothetical protein [Verrucomicrobiales bacterium]
MTKVLVIGTGYLGDYLIHLLRENDCEVRAASKNGGDNCCAADLGCRASIANLAGDLERENFSPDFIVHCASSSRGGPDAYRLVFVEGTKNLISEFPGSHKILTSST